MHILAFDPGPKMTGWALVARHASGGSRVVFRGAGRMVSDQSSLTDLLHSVERLHGAFAVAIESPAGYIHDVFRGPTVIATAFVAGGLSWMAEHLAHEVFAIPAAQVRTALLGKPKLGFRQKKGDVDRAIKAALPSFVDRLPAKTNVHVRDAVALAVAANWLWLAKQRRRA